MLAGLKRFYYREQYNPGLGGLFINPFFLARRALWRAVAGAGGQMRGRLLDVGCGTKPYRALFDVTRYVGLDIDNALTRARAVADAFYDGGSFPFDDGAFDSVLCNQVLEHVFTPDAFVRECCRVLVPGGKLLLTVPFVWDEHEQPFDFARYSSFGLKSLLEKNGFRIVSHRKLLSDASILFQLCNAYLFKVTRSRWTMLNLVSCVLLFAPLSALGLLLGAVLPRNPDLFMDQLVVAEKDLIGTGHA